MRRKQRDPAERRVCRLRPPPAFANKALSAHVHLARGHVRTTAANLSGGCHACVACEALKSHSGPLQKRFADSEGTCFSEVSGINKLYLGKEAAGVARRVGQAGRRRGPHARGLGLVRGAFSSRRRRWPEGPRFARGRGGPGRRGDRGGEDERQTVAPRGIGASPRRERWAWARTEAGGTCTQLLGARLLRAGSVLPLACSCVWM